MRAKIKINSIREVIIGLAIALVLFVFSFALIGTSIREQKAREEIKVISEVNILKSKLQNELNIRVYLNKGLEAYIKMNNHINHEDFQKFAANLIDEDPVIKNITLLEQTTVIDVFPLKGNESVLGKDLALIDTQRLAIMEAIESRNMVIDGPVNLVQGGIAIINRIPIFIDQNGKEDVYWGMVSIVLLKEELIKKSGFDSEELEISLNYS